MPEISALPAEATLGGTEMIPMVQSGTTERTTPAIIAAYTFTGYGAANTATARAAISAQEADATLTALAGQNWAANSLPIGSGADAVAQVAFAANTFPARASTGNLVAKSITDAALSVLDDTTVAAMRTTLGFADGTYTPTATALTNCSAAAIQGGTAQYLRVGNTVTVSGQVRLTATAAALAVCEARISLPIATALTANSNQIAGTANATQAAGSAQIPGVVYANFTFDEAVVRFNAPDTNAHDFWFHFTYQVI